ncbi:MAG: right-handed parallel beta-helix repeat-containing protein [Methanophagales archaeon]|nr:right-handed parallel beta-helix repeat-containing protein [Methanophagales archaeon]
MRNKKEANERECKVSSVKKSILAAILVISALAMFTGVASAYDPPCTCGDICVNETGWWRANADFNASNTPIQHAIDNATAGNTICVKEGSYNENVDVNKQLTIRSEKGSALTIVNASDPNKCVFVVTVNYVNISGFTVKDGFVGIYLSNNVGHCNISDNNATNNTDGFRLDTSSHDNTLTNNTANSNSGAGILCLTSSDNILTNNTANSDEYGIWLYNSSNNNTLTNNTANSNNVDGFLLQDSSNNNTLTNNNASGNKGIGIYLWGTSQSNNLTSNKISGNELSGIELRDSCGNNKIQDNNISLNTNDAIFVDGSSNKSRIIANNLSFNGHYGIHVNNSHESNITGNIILSNSWDGIRLSSSSNNTLTNNTASNNTDYDFWSDQNSHNNTAEDLTISSYPTTISFTYDQGIKLKGVTTPEPDPVGKANIGKYVNATNVTANSWIFLNVSYTDADVSGVVEGSLLLYKWNETASAWELANETGKPNGVNTTGNYVYANVTSFSQIAPFGNPTPTPPVPVPVFNTMGLLALIGILMVLAVVTLRKRK